MNRSRLLALLLLLASAPAVHAGYDPPGPDPTPGGSCEAGDVIVNTTAQNTFNPSRVTINVGDVVCFRNNSSMPHNIHALGSLRCSSSCSSPYNANDPASAPAGNWVVRITFTDPGNLPFQCDAHVALGMTGEIIVLGGGGGGGGAGTLAFSAGSSSVGESAGNATVTVNRTGGTTGAVAVNYATSNLTATAGADYTAKSGTLNWAAGDGAAKTLTIPILGDTVDEPNETLRITLSSPTGGATLGSPSQATLTINDDDAGGGGGGGGGGASAPAAPTGLTAEPTSTSEIDLSWHDNSSNESQFLIERKTFGGAFTQVGTAVANSSTYPEDGLDPATYYIFRVRASNNTGNSGYSNEVGATTNDTPAPCVAGAETLCFVGGRFQVEMHYRFAGGQSGAGKAVPLTDGAGAFYFQNANNLEMLIKVVNACSLNQHFWVFYAATTNVELTITVTDTQTGRVKTYVNPLGTAAPPVQDTGAFATCPS